jgi:hypothetical protein
MLAAWLATNCKHYVLRTMPSGERLQRCVVKANEELPFGCPDGCLFFEPRTRIAKIGWERPTDENR